MNQNKRKKIFADFMLFPEGEKHKCFMEMSDSDFEILKRILLFIDRVRDNSKNDSKRESSQHNGHPLQKKKIRKFLSLVDKRIGKPGKGGRC